MLLGDRTTHYSVQQHGSSSAGTRLRQIISAEEWLFRLVKVLALAISGFVVYKEQYIFLVASFPMLLLDQVANILANPLLLPSHSGGAAARRQRSRPLVVKILAVLCLFTQLVFVAAILLTEEAILDELATIGSERISQGVTGMLLAPLAVKDEAGALLRRIKRQNKGTLDEEEERAEFSRGKKHEHKRKHAATQKLNQKEPREVKVGNMASPSFVNKHTGAVTRAVSKHQKRKPTDGQRYDKLELEIPAKNHSTRDIQMNLNRFATNATARMSGASKRSVMQAVGTLLPVTSAPDTRYRSAEEVRARYTRVFQELPTDGYRTDLKNPCWDLQASEPILQKEMDGSNGGVKTACLPYVYLLGQPKSGTSDLFSRITAHPGIHPPRRKEIRWFTRGEFTTDWMPREDVDSSGVQTFDSSTKGITSKLRLGNDTSIKSFTRNFDEVVGAIKMSPLQGITIDGGPHNLWWPIQNANGDVDDSDVPVPQLLREIQPNAKFIVTLNDPVKRMYSDYYFLGDDLKPVQKSPGRKHKKESSRSNSKLQEGSAKSAAEFHERAKRQVEDFEKCLLWQGETATPPDGKGEKLASWLRASQTCAHDRNTFAVGGHGRLSIGLYSLYFLKWLDHFPPSQFLFVRLEDYNTDPQAYLDRIFTFLDLPTIAIDADGEQAKWQRVALQESFKNANKATKETMQEDTKQLLERFYHPFNGLLADLLDEPSFQWRYDGNSHSNGASKTAKKDAGVEIDEDVTGNHHSIDNMHRSNEEDHTLSDITDLDDIASASNSLPKTGLRGGTEELSLPKPSKAPLFVFPRRLDLNGLPYNETADVLELNVLLNDGRMVNQKAWKEQLQMQEELLPHLKSVDTSNPFQFSDLSNADQKLTMSKYSQLQNFYTGPDAKAQVCLASFTLDINLLKFLLYDMGIPETALDNYNIYEAKILKDDQSGPFPVPRQKSLRFIDRGRTAWHCLAELSTMADASSKSYVFSILKGSDSWLDPLMSPPLQKNANSAMAPDIMNSISTSVHNVALWLERVGLCPFVGDSYGNSALHLASRGGMFELVSFILVHSNSYEGKEALDVIDKGNLDGRTAMHFAVNQGNILIASLLQAYGASLNTLDKHNVTPLNMIDVPGPISMADAKEFLGVEQRPPKKILRLLHPENKENTEKNGAWKAGNGGWSEARLDGYETDMSCDIDQYWAHEVTGEQIFNEYVAPGRPVLIRGLINDWPVVDLYTKRVLSASKEDFPATDDGQMKDTKEFFFGDFPVQVSEIPYATKFGASPRIDMSLKQYISEVLNHTTHTSEVTGSKRPWYVFKGHPIPKQSENRDSSFVVYEDMMTPSVIQMAFERLAKRTPTGLAGILNNKLAGGKRSSHHEEDNNKYVSSRAIYINAQWAVGDKGSGAPVHFHNTAWNALIYGAKKWIMYPPAQSIMSKEQILDFIEKDLVAIAEKPQKSYTVAANKHEKKKGQFTKTYVSPQVKPLTCVQTAGDVMIVPESWSHGVLNIQQSVAVATESKGSFWRTKQSGIMNAIPTDYDNRKDGRMRDKKNRERNEN